MLVASATATTPTKRELREPQTSRLHTSRPALSVPSQCSALYRDYPVFMGTSLLYAVAVLVSNLITDLAYAVVDPRIRYS